MAAGNIRTIGIVQLGNEYFLLEVLPVRSSESRILHALLPWHESRILHTLGSNIRSIRIIQLGNEHFILEVLPARASELRKLHALLPGLSTGCFKP